MADPRIVREESAEALDRAVAALAAGMLVVFPTDTVYGLAADPTVEGATDRVFATKRRSRELTLPVLADGIEGAATVAAFDPRARALAAGYWPGPLTIVLSRAGTSRSWDLGEHRASVGVRVPDHLLALELLRRTGPLAVTSANISGAPTPSDCDEILRDLGDHVALVLCWGPAPEGRASTVVDLTEHRVRVLREGEVTSSEIEKLVGSAPEGLE